MNLLSVYIYGLFTTISSPLYKLLSFFHPCYQFVAVTISCFVMHFKLDLGLRWTKYNSSNRMQLLTTSQMEHYYSMHACVHLCVYVYLLNLQTHRLQKSLYFHLFILQSVWNSGWESLYMCSWVVYISRKQALKTVTIVVLEVSHWSVCTVEFVHYTHVGDKLK